jgi:DNA (cytosine-5)-methyltransferase 1
MARAGRRSGGTDQFQVEYSPVEPEADISRFAIGKQYDATKVGENSERYFNLARPSPDEPCPTITQTGGVSSAAAVVHPFEKRKFSIAELKRICAFPDDFCLSGSYAQQWERLGRAVPPLMMYAIAAAVRDGVLAKIGAKP